MITLLPARDLSVTAVNPASGVAAAPAALRISFSYSHRIKARDFVQMLIMPRILSAVLRVEVLRAK